MSREHVFSRSVFRKNQGSVMRVVGMPNIPDGPIGPDVPAARILCRKHNALLSELDSEAGKLADALHLFHDGHTGKTVHISGLLIERWALKTIVNHMSAGFGDESKWHPSSEVVRIIYGQEPTPDGCGLYTLSLNNFLPLSAEQVNVTPLWLGDPNGSKVLKGAVVFLHGATFFCSFSSSIVSEIENKPVIPGTSKFELKKSCISYRPPLMSMISERGNDLYVLFDWG